jgi:hypothetical protein
MASEHAEIQYLGYPFPENFQMEYTQNHCRVLSYLEEI